MKKMLNEWKKFLNENEGEDYYIRTWAAIPSEDPAGEQRYSVKMSNGEEFVAEFGEDLVVKYSKSGEPAKEGIFDKVVKFIIEDLPYEWDGRAQDDDPEGFKRAMKMIDSLHPRYLDIRKKEKERDAGDAGKQMGLPNVDEQEEVAASSFDKRSQQIAKIHDGFVDFLEVEGIFPMGEIPKSVMDALMKAAMLAVDAMENDLDERCEKGYKTHPTTKTKKMYGKTYRNCVKAEE